MNRLGFLLWLGLTTVFLPAETFGGLIDQPQTFPWTAGFTPSGLSEAGGLLPGEVRLQSSTLWFNTYRQLTQDDSVLQRIDMEGLLPTVSLAWSWAEGWEARAQVQGWILGGGILDAAISGFHGGLQVPDQGRGDVSNNQYRDLLRGQFDVTKPEAGLTQASVGVRSFLGPWSWWTWIKPPLPKASPDWGWTSSWGAGSSGGWGDRWPEILGDLTLSAGANVALIVIAPDAEFPMQKGNLAFQGGGYLALGPATGGRFLVEATATQVPRDGEGYLGQPAGLLTLGWQQPWSDSFGWYTAITEEFLTWATMEVGLQVGFTWSPFRQSPKRSE